MGKLDLNFGKVGALPPEQETLLRIEDVHIKMAANKQSLNMEVDFAIAEHDDLDWVNHKFKQWINLGEKSLWKAQEFLEAVTGDEWREDEMNLVTDSEDENDPTGRLVSPDLVSSEVIGALVHSTDNNDKPVIAVKVYLRP